MESNVEFFLVDCCDIYRAHCANLMALLAMSAQDDAMLEFDDRSLHHRKDAAGSHQYGTQIILWPVSGSL